MLFATFQSQEVVDKLKSEGVYAIEEYHPFCNNNGVKPTSIEEKVGFKPIFSFPFTDKRDFIARSQMEFPSFPQYMIIFKSSVYRQVGYLGWIRTLNHYSEPVSLEREAENGDLDEGIYVDYLDIDKRGIFNEYIVPIIELKNVKKIVHITDNINIFSDLGRTVCDDFCDFIASKDCTKLLDKYIKGDTVRYSSPADISKDKADIVCKGLYNLVNNFDKIDEKYLFKVYNDIKLYCTK